MIEARAQTRLADEYDAAQARGEVTKHGEIGRGRVSKKEYLSSVTDIGLTSKQVHEARKIRDAEKEMTFPDPNSGWRIMVHGRHSPTSNAGVRLRALVAAPARGA